MTRPLLSLFALLFGTTLVAHAQQANGGDYRYEHDSSNYNYKHEYHYEHGPWGYRAEAQLMDSLAVLEMMGEISPAEARQKQEKFRKDKKTRSAKRRIRCARSAKKRRMVKRRKVRRTRTSTTHANYNLPFAHTS